MFICNIYVYEELSQKIRIPLTQCSGSIQGHPMSAKACCAFDFSLQDQYKTRQLCIYKIDKDGSIASSITTGKVQYWLSVPTLLLTCSGWFACLPKGCRFESGGNPQRFPDAIKLSLEAANVRIGERE